MLAVLLSVVWLRLRGFDRLLDDTLLDRAFRFDVCALDHLLDDTLLDRVLGFGVYLLLLADLDDIRAFRNASCERASERGGPASLSQPVDGLAA